MTNTDALLALADKVEAGTVPDNGFCAIWHRSGHCVDAQNAYHGSLDAAKALMEALLPGWAWSVNSLGFAEVWPSADGPTYEGYNDDDARALLLAIIRALIAGGRE